MHPPYLVIVLLLVLVTHCGAQVSAPNKDEKGNIKIPSAASIRQFHARLPAEKLQQRDPPNDASRERALSLTLFGQGRLAYQQENYERALAAYQRAWFWNSNEESILSDIVEIAFHTQREQLAIRYAILASERDPRDPAMMEQLGMILAQEGESPRGLAMIKSALALHTHQAKLENRETKDALSASLQLSLARLSLLEEDYGSAADSFDILREVVARPSEFGLDETGLAELTHPIHGFYSLMAESYLQSKQLDKAAQAYEKLHELNASDPLDTYHQAVLAFHAKDVDGAKSRLTEYFESESEEAGPAPYVLLKKIFERETPDDDRRKKFLRAIEKLVNNDPANEVLTEFASTLFVEQERYADALEWLESLLGGKPTIQTYDGLAKIYHALDMPGKLVALLGQAVEATGDLTVVKNAIDQFVTDEKALSSLRLEANRRRADTHRPMSGSEAFGLALVFLAAEKFDEADQFYDTAVKQTRDPQTFAEQELLWAEEAFFAEYLPAARKMFAKILENPGEGVNAISVSELLAMAHELDGETQMALDVIGNALNTFAPTDPDVAALTARRGWVLYHAGRNDEAAAAYQTVINRFSDDYSDPAIRLAIKDARSIYSAILVERGEKDEADELLLKILDEFPEDVGAQNDLAYLWADAGLHPYRALEMAKRAVAAEPDNPAYLDTLGWAYHRLDQSKQALEHLEKATENPKTADSVILDHLGDVYHSLSDDAQAEDAWQRAIASLEAMAAEEERELTTKEIADRQKIQSKIESSGPLEQSSAD